MDWRTASYSSAQGGACVEVASHTGVAVRDTTDRDSVMLTFTVDAWTRFTASLR